MRLEPINDFVILKKLTGEQEYNGIFIPEEDGQQLVLAQVVAAGPGQILNSGERAPMQVKAGDEVYVNTYACAPTQLPIEEEGEFVLIPQKDIAAIVRRADDQVLSQGSTSLEVAVK